MFEVLDMLGIEEATQKKWYNFDGHKLIYHMDRVYKHFRDNDRIYPLHIDIGTTKACNAKCVYCYGIFQNMTGDIMPKEALLNVFGTVPLTIITLG